jgi:hypothetical protein
LEMSSQGPMFQCTHNGIRNVIVFLHGLIRPLLILLALQLPLGFSESGWEPDLTAFKVGA